MQQLTFKTLPPALRDYTDWADVEEDGQCEEDAERVRRFVPAIRYYLDTGKLSASAELAQCARQTLLDQVNRCVMLKSDGQPVGWAGLLYGLRLNPYLRTKALSASDGQGPSGKAGAFEQFLRENPDHRKFLDDLIRKGGGSGNAIPSKPSFKGVAKKFVAYLRNKGFTDNDYPLDSKSEGGRSVERYAHKFVALDAKAITAWYGETAAVQLSLGTGKHSFDFFSSPLDLVGADAHKFDCVGVMTLNGPAGPQHVPISRIWFHPVVDRRSKAICGYSVSITKEISSAVVEEAFVASNTVWTPRKLRVEGLEYIEGAGFPVGTIDGLTACRPCAAQFDNAAVNFSNRVVARMRRALGCMVGFGPVAGWWNNGFVERLFGCLESLGIQRLPSGTGTGPGDPMRRNPAAEAIKHRATWEELLDLVDVMCANYNATPQSALGNQSPLDCMRRHMEAALWLPRMTPPSSSLSPALGVTVETGCARGGLKKGSAVNVYIQIDKVRYTNDFLRGRFDLVGQPFTLHIPEKDMREVQAYLPNGQSIGVLKVVDKRWAKTPHSRSLRKTINQLLESGEISKKTDCYVETYMEHLAKKASKEARARPASVSPAATRLADVARETGASVPPLPRKPAKASPAVVPRAPLPGYIKPPTW